MTVEIAHLFLDVVERVGRVDGKADENHVGVGVGKRTETVVVLLASRIPQGELDAFSIDLDVGDVVLKDGGDVDLAMKRQRNGEKKKTCPAAKNLG